MRIMLEYLVDRFGLQVVLRVVLGLALLYVIRVVYAMREGIRWFLRAAATSVLVLLLGLAFLPEFHLSNPDASVLSILAAVTTFALTPKRSRYVPAEVKRQVIGRDLKGKKYSSKKHHIDHIWPHALGGSSTTDNLRVVSRKVNLRKGAKRPKLTDWL